MPETPAPPLRRTSLLEALDIQRCVIGALVLRELHTRYGRDNIGYLWLMAEPLLLAGAVALIHMGPTSGGHYGPDLRPVPFTLVGYCTFIIFRSIVSRAESALTANQTLLFHRVVTIFDMLVARAVLEVLSSLSALAILLAGAVAAGLADPPAEPLLLLAGIGFLSWMSFGLSLSICTATYFSKAVAKFIHPVVYILMPLSGAFFLLKWIPEPYRTWLSWSPLNQTFEMIHSGQFRSVDSPYYDPLYLTVWCMGLTLIGLASLRVLRRHVHLN